MKLDAIVFMNFIFLVINAYVIYAALVYMHHHGIDSSYFSGSFSRADTFCVLSIFGVNIAMCLLSSYGILKEKTAYIVISMIWLFGIKSLLMCFITYFFVVIHKSVYWLPFFVYWIIYIMGTLNILLSQRSSGGDRTQHLIQSVYRPNDNQWAGIEHVHNPYMPTAPTIDAMSISTNRLPVHPNEYSNDPIHHTALQFRRTNI